MCGLWDLLANTVLPDSCVLLCGYCPKWSSGKREGLAHRRQQVRWSLWECSSFFSLPMSFGPKSKIKAESDCLALLSSLHYCFAGLSPTSLLVWIVSHLTISEMFIFSHVIKFCARSWLKHEGALKLSCFCSCFPNENQDRKDEQNHTCFLRFQQKKLMQENLAFCVCCVVISLSSENE